MYRYSCMYLRKYDRMQRLKQNAFPSRCRFADSVYCWLVTVAALGQVAQVCFSRFAHATVIMSHVTDLLVCPAIFV